MHNSKRIVNDLYEILLWTCFLQLSGINERKFKVAIVWSEEAKRITSSSFSAKIFHWCSCFGCKRWFHSGNYCLPTYISFTSSSIIWFFFLVWQLSLLFFLAKWYSVLGWVENRLYITSENMCAASLSPAMFPPPFRTYYCPSFFKLSCLLID